MNSESYVVITDASLNLSQLYECWLSVQWKCSFVNIDRASLPWRHNGRGSVLNHQLHECLRVSSHSLAIERGRHLGTVIQERLCTVSNVIEEEKHFLFECCINEELRFIFNSRVSQLYPQYQFLDSDQKLVFLFKIENEQLITWVGKFVYNSFCLREEYHGKRG